MHGVERLGGEVETGCSLGQQAGDGERHAGQHGDGVKEIGQRAKWVASHWWESLCCWRRRNHDPLTAIVDKYFEHPSFFTPHFLLAMPSSLTATRDSRDSLGARERESFFASHTPPAPQSITSTPPAIDQAPSASHRPPINQRSAAPIARLRRLHDRRCFVLFVWGLFCLVEREETQSINPINQSSWNPFTPLKENSQQARRPNDGDARLPALVVFK